QQIRGVWLLIEIAIVQLHIKCDHSLIRLSDRRAIELMDVKARNEVGIHCLLPSAKSLLREGKKSQRHSIVLPCSNTNATSVAGAPSIAVQSARLDVDSDSVSYCPTRPSFLAGRTFVTQVDTHPTDRYSKLPNNLTSSPELLRRRQEQRAAAQALTKSLVTCCTVAEAREMYECYGEQFNGIHFAALFTALGRLETAVSHPPSHKASYSYSASLSSPSHIASPPPGSRTQTAYSATLPSRPMARSFHQSLDQGVAAGGTGHSLPINSHSSLAATCPGPRPASLLPMHRTSVVSRPRALSYSERAELREFVSKQLVPHLGLRLLGLGSRQLATVLAVLAQLNCPPPSFWLSEWLQHFARRIAPLPATISSATASALPALPAEARHAQIAAAAAATAVTHPTVAGNRGFPAAETTPSALIDSSCRSTSTDIARAMWALARLRRNCSAARAPVKEHGTGMRATAISTASALADGEMGMRCLYQQRHLIAATSSRGGRLGSATDIQSHVGAGLGDPSLASSPRASGDDGPSLVWLQTISSAFAAQAASASPADLASYFWAVARLGYRPPAAVMQILMTRCGHLLEGNCGHHSGSRGSRDGQRAAHCATDGSISVTAVGVVSCIGPRELCMVLWALAVLGFFPGDAWLRLAGKGLMRMAVSSTPRVTRVARGRMPACTAQPRPPDPPPPQLQPPVAAAGPLASVAVAAAATVEEFLPNSDWWTSHLSNSKSAAVAASVRQEDGVVSGQLQAADALLDSRQAATCAWAFARLGHRPSERVLATLLRSTCMTAPAATANAAAAQDLSMTSFALGVLRFRPEPDQALAMMASMATRLPDASPQDLVVWAGALARMRLAVPDPWFAKYLRRVAEELEEMPPLALVNWLDAVARLRTARLPRCSRLEGELMRRAHFAEIDAKVGRERSEFAMLAPPAAGHSDPSSINGDPRSDPWVVLALPQAKPPRAVLRATASHQRRRRHRESLPQPRRALPDPAGTIMDLSRSPASPPPPLPPSRMAASQPQYALASPAGAESSAPALAAADAGSAPPAAVVKRESIFIRPAARHLQRQRLMPRLLRLAASHLPQLGLEEHCRLAWAVAHLQTTVRRSWVDELIARTTEMLERRLGLHQQWRQPLQGAQQRQHVGGRGIAGFTAAAPPLKNGAVPEASLATQVPAVDVVVDARWLLKLVRAVEMLLRGPRQGCGNRRLQLTQRLHRQRRQRTGGVDTPVAISAPEPQLRSGALSYSYIPRRWRLLLMMAMLPQLSALSNAQLLRFVRTLARLHANPAGGGAGKPASSGDVGAGVDVAGAGAGAGPPVGGRRGPQRRLASELGSYCRRRVEVTCGAAEACDLTTTELLRWTRGWEVDKGDVGGAGQGDPTAYRRRAVSPGFS
ncbi:hypothetical protein VaNZ11_003849, partial [Volvox africanus]